MMLKHLKHINYFIISLVLSGIFVHCHQKKLTSRTQIRPSRYVSSDPILTPPSFANVLTGFEQLHQNYFEKKHHQFHHRNAKDFSRFEGSYGLGTWDLFGDNIDIPGNREERNATPYPLASVAAKVAQAYLYAFAATEKSEYQQAAVRVLDEFLKHEQVRALKPEELTGIEMSIIGSFANWQIRSIFPNQYLFAGYYSYIDNPTPLQNDFELLKKLSIPPLKLRRTAIAYDSIGYNPAVNKGTILAYSGRVIPQNDNLKNSPHPDAAVEAVLAYTEAILQDLPNKENYLGIISRAAHGFYGFDLQNRWDTPCTEVGARVTGLAATVRAMRKFGLEQLISQPQWRIEELLRDARLRIRMVADPKFPGWFQGWTPGGPLPDRYDWWIIQSGPDFFGTDIINNQRYPWFLLIHDHYDSHEDNQLWYFSQVLFGLADFYPLLLDEPEAELLRLNVQDFLCQGFNYFLHFQDTSEIASMKGGIQPDAYSVREFAINQQNFASFNDGDETIIKRYSHPAFENEALTYPFPMGLQAAMTAAMNIPELAEKLQPLIFSGMNHLLACNVFFQDSLAHPELESMRNWLAPDVFKTLGLYLIYHLKFEK